MRSSATGSDCAVLELTMRGGVFERWADMGIALAGAPIEASIVGTDGNPRRFRVPSSGSLHAGERLVLGRTLEGGGTDPSVDSGFQTPVRMGSRSCEQPLRRGDFLNALARTLPTRHLGEPLWSNAAAEPFRIIGGPEARCLITPEFWMQSRFRVSSRSNRMGLRLEGPPLELTTQPDRLSAPVAPGAIQVAGGQLILLGVACGTMGGYPHVAHVISADLDRVGQLCPGDQIAFRLVDLATARNLDLAARQAHRALLIRVASLARDA